MLQESHGGVVIAGTQQELLQRVGGQATSKCNNDESPRRCRQAAERSYTQNGFEHWCKLKTTECKHYLVRPNASFSNSSLQ